MRITCPKDTPDDFQPSDERKASDEQGNLNTFVSMLGELQQDARWFADQAAAAQRARQIVAVASNPAARAALARPIVGFHLGG